MLIDQTHTWSKVSNQEYRHNKYEWVCLIADCEDEFYWDCCNPYGKIHRDKNGDMREETFEAIKARAEKWLDNGI